MSTEEKKIKLQDIRTIWYFFKPYKAKVAILTFMTGLSTLLEALSIVAFYPIMNYGLHLENHQQGFLLRKLSAVVESWGTQNLLRTASIILIIVAAAAIITKLIYYYLANKLMTQIVGNIQKAIWDKFATADYSFYVKNQQGKLIHASTVAPFSASDSVLYSIRLMYDSLQSLFFFSALMLLSWHATIILLVIALLYAFFIKKVMGQIIYRCSRLAVEADRWKNVILNELISGVKTIKVFASFDSWKEKYVTAVETSLSNRFKMLMGRTFPEMSIKFLFVAMVAGVGIVLSQRSSVETLHLLPVLGTFAIVASRFFPTLQLIGNSLIIINECVPNARIVHQLCTQKVRDIPPGTQEVKGFQRKLSFEGVGFTYSGVSEPVLKDVSFDIEKGKVTAIVGHSGAGKTTIINLLLKLYQPTQGHIKLDGIDIFEFTDKSYLGLIGYVSQETFVFNDTIKENIRFGMENVSLNMIIEAAKLANAHEFIEETKDGYETVVGDAGIKLSGGQRQRIAIARAILRKPEIIIFDEATGSLDNISERKIQDAINEISRRTTVLTIAHRLSTVQNAHKIILLDKGQIKEVGTHEQLMNKKDIYYRLYTAKTVEV